MMEVHDRFLLVGLGIFVEKLLICKSGYLMDFQFWGEFFHPVEGLIIFIESDGPYRAFFVDFDPASEIIRKEDISFLYHSYSFLHSR